jgi:hypothetical protein
MLLKAVWTICSQTGSGACCSPADGPEFLRWHSCNGQHGVQQLPVVELDSEVAQLKICKERRTDQSAQAGCHHTDMPSIWTQAQSTEGLCRPLKCILRCVGETQVSVCVNTQVNERVRRHHG